MEPRTNGTSSGRSIICILAAIFWVATAHASPAKTFNWVRSSDALTLDPHSINEGTTHTLNHQIYEPLLVRDRTGKVEPALATQWTQQIDPLRWIFTLRQGVEFHDGQPLTAADVIFSLNRALSETSDLRTRLQGIDSFKAIGPDKLEITTRVRDPLLPIRLTDIFIMSETWARTHEVMRPQNFLAGEKTYAANHANGTGPYKLVSREPGKETRLTRNERYWGWEEKELSRRIADISYRPIPDDKERITALLNGSVDFVQDVPLTELDVLRQAPGLTMKVGPENRVIFLGLSVKPTLDGKPNPLAKTAVREAISLAIDRFAIQHDIMLGQSIPTGVVAPPGINGFPSDLDIIPKRNLPEAREWLKSAGVAQGTELTLDCPKHRYVNDAAICAAVAKQLADVNLKVKVALHSKEEHFQRVRAGNSQFFLLGWGVPTFDSAYIFTNLYHTRTQDLGTWNGTGYSDPEIDRKIASLSNMSTPGSRSRTMSEIWQIVTDARLYVPLHVQTLIYAMRKGVDIEVDISNTPKLKNAIVTAEAEPKSE